MKKIKLSEDQITAFESQVGFRSVINTPTHSVGDIVRWFHKRKRAGMDIFDGVVLGISGDGATQDLLVFDPACEEPEVINVREVQKLSFANATDDLKAISKAVLYFKNSAKYFSR